MSRRRQWNPMFQVAKCEMCPNQVDDIVTGLCVRCFSIWATEKPRLINTCFNYKHVRAAIVSACQEHSRHRNMHSTFLHAIEREKYRRRLKVELFQRVRAQFQNNVLLEAFTDQEPRPFHIEDDYYNVPEIYDRDFILFQHQVDMLEDMIGYNKALEDLNNNYFYYRKSYTVIK
ncbi:uncharacterized protein Dana_GF17146 [Drosophila ananassae]|uniref:Uncharacterized protein n=1 Tax=Drosophila ananassae TaxID=7217 RepID=B3M1D6_DROAN|nr:uncharacterized protein LOC6499934 [Drosophila ananassae]EDV42163.1 uncharacterized protein Dana_GF17146 [Drosophila ananassae]